ncbi:hypothetical protein [Hymenobacter sp. B81]|uniref:hypothetical protein n=1 Tax=Hymenobacter sp. B81 TaxID=3344878 RepID=UPI0037DDCB1D
MISTVFLLQLLAFQLWYRTSPQVKQPVGYPAYAVKNPLGVRAVGVLLAAATAALLAAHWGWMTGLCAWLVGLMGVGSLVVALAPLRLLNAYAVALLFTLALALELLF